MDDLREANAAPAHIGEITIDERDRVVSDTPAFDIYRYRAPIAIAASSLTLGLGIGWICGASSGFFRSTPAAAPVEQAAAPEFPPDRANSDRLEVRGPTTGSVPAPTAIGRAPETSSKQNAAAPRPAGSERPKVATRPVPVPETRPTTIAGWTLREVNGGTAVLEGPSGVWKATRGETVPGVGRIETIVRWGNRWIVATSKGLISTP